MKAKEVIVALGLVLALSLPARAAEKLPHEWIAVSAVEGCGSASRSQRLAAGGSSASRCAAGVHRFRVEMARSEAERERGLMFRTHLAPDAGMLFVYSPPVAGVRFWMKDTLIPLDMLFVGPADKAGWGKVVMVVRRAKPGDLTPVGPDVPVAAVVELLGGTAAKDGIAVGDRVRVIAKGKERR